MSEFHEPIKRISNVLVITAIIGLVASIYLTYQHYAILSNPNVHSFCDVSNFFSCSEVNSSKYAEFLNTPVALIGVLYFIVALVFSIKSLKNGYYYNILVATHLLGLFSVLYLVYAEWVLSTVCLICTIVHIMILAGLITGIVGLKMSNQHFSKNVFVGYHKKVLVYLIIGLLIVGYNFFLSDSGKGLPFSFAQCLTEKGVVMYGSYTCSVCLAEKKLFGPSFKYLNYVECHPAGPNADLKKCRKVPVEAYPTWTLETNGTIVKKEVGYLNDRQLSIFAECELPKY